MVQMKRNMLTWNPIIIFVLKFIIKWIFRVSPPEWSSVGNQRHAQNIVAEAIRNDMNLASFCVNRRHVILF